jgi:hypothetical protein
MDRGRFIRRMKMIYYFGCWSGVGHYLWLSNGRRCDEVRATLPWNQIDSDLAPGLRDRRDGYVEPSEQTEGRGSGRAHGGELTGGGKGGRKGAGKGNGRAVGMGWGMVGPRRVDHAGCSAS